MVEILICDNHVIYYRVLEVNIYWIKLLLKMVNVTVKSFLTGESLIEYCNMLNQKNGLSY